MPTLARNQASDCANPELDIFFDVGGVATDVDSLEFQIFEDVTTPGTLNQVYPVMGRATVDLADCPAGDKLATGRYVAEYTPDLSEPVGNHVIRWFFRISAGSPEQSFDEEFTVTLEGAASSANGYTTVAALREEGVTVSMASDTRLQTLIERVSHQIDLFTGRFFEPRSLTLRVDGHGSHILQLEHPIISIDDVAVLEVDPFASPNATLDIDDLVIYNRHLSQGLLDPDDRENPRIEFFSSEYRYRDAYGASANFILNRFPQGAQNIEVDGVFGYTEPDGSPQGRTPLLIQHAANLMVIRELPLLTASDDRDDARSRGRITKIKTRDQEVNFATGASTGAPHQSVGHFTGDPEIDNILASFMRPPAFGAA